MKESISEHLIDVCYQLRDFLRTGHKFFDLVAIDIKSFIIDAISQYFSLATPKLVRNRRRQTSEQER